MGRALRWKVQSVNRWIWLFRFFAVLMVIAFILVLMSLQVRYTKLKNRMPPATTSTSR
jgi:hypothetical protein